MKADITDAPERVIRTHHKRIHWWVGIGVFISSVATISAFHFTSRTSTADPAFNKAFSSTGRDEQSTHAGGSVLRQTLYPSGLRASDTQLPVNLARENEYNDQNYIPRGADNVVAFRTAYNPSPEKKTPQKAKLTIVRQSPSMKDRVCWPYRQGSIESRNCRASVGLKHRD